MRIAIIAFKVKLPVHSLIHAIESAGMCPVLYSTDAMEGSAPCDVDGYVVVSDAVSVQNSRIKFLNELNTLMSFLYQQNDRGKAILGIGYGAHILVEMGLVPGLTDHQVGMALINNQCVYAEKKVAIGCDEAHVHVRLSMNYQRGALTKYLLPQMIFKLLLTQGAGCFSIPCGLLEEVMHQGLAVFQYCDPFGEILPDFPVNPIGSIRNIAALSNKAGNVLAIIPELDDALALKDALFQSMRDYIAANLHEAVIPLYYTPRLPLLSDYKPPVVPSSASVIEYALYSLEYEQEAQLIKTILADDGDASLVHIVQYVHWEMIVEKTSLLSMTTQLCTVLRHDEAIMDQARVRARALRDDINARVYLIREKVDWISTALQKQLVSQQPDMPVLRSGRLWCFSGDAFAIAKVTDYLLRTHWLRRPEADECYLYTHHL